MNVTCPSCGAEMDLDVLLAHEDSRQALARLVAISVPLGRAVLQYLRLFRPAKRQMSHGRVVKLIEELLPDIERGAISHKGRDWAATRETWKAAIEKMLSQRDELVLPMQSHVYLYAILAGLADKAEAHAERDTESARRARTTDADAQPGPAPVLDAIAHAPATPAPQYAGPSAYARKLQAQIEARTKARAGGADDESEAT